MDAEEIMGMMALMALVVIPALALTARFAMKPIVESIVQLRKAFNEETRSNAVEAGQMALLEREIAELRRDVDALKAEREFDKQLRAATPPQLEPPR